MIALLLILAGFAAGFINVIAGGGGFLTFPALVAAGMTALGANASSTVALFPAQVLTAYMARDSLVLPSEATGVSLRGLCVIAFGGGFTGGLLLLITPPGLFVSVVPWLILFATGVFASSDRLRRGATGFQLGRGGIYATQTVVSIYGGYFGGGIGIMLLAALALFGFRDMRVMNGAKIVLAMFMSIAAVATFVLTGLVRWDFVLFVATGSLSGGWAGMHVVKRVPAAYVRWTVVVIGILLAIGFFVKSAGA